MWPIKLKFTLYIEHQTPYIWYVQKASKLQKTRKLFKNIYSKVVIPINLQKCALHQVIFSDTGEKNKKPRQAFCCFVVDQSQRSPQRPPSPARSDFSYTQFGSQGARPFKNNPFGFFLRSVLCYIQGEPLRYLAIFFRNAPPLKKSCIRPWGHWT